jgi:hypothetical protein
MSEKPLGDRDMAEASSPKERREIITLSKAVGRDRFPHEGSNSRQVTLIDGIEESRDPSLKASRRASKSGEVCRG